VADRVVVINKGKIEQVGSPQDVYDNPVSPFVYQFLGNVNQFNSHVHEGEAKIGNLELKLANHQTTQNSEGLAFVRPHDIEIEKQPRKNQAGFTAVVSYVHAIGPLVRVELQRSGEKDLIEAELTQERYRELAISQGENVFIYPRNVRVFLNT
jgi:sulfate transport system ATP-binding protein